MSCEICCEKEKAYGYGLKDGTFIDICHECAGILYGKPLEPLVPDRLHQIAMLRSFLSDYKKYSKIQTCEIIEIKKEELILKKAM